MKFVIKIGFILFLGIFYMQGKSQEIVIDTEYGIYIRGISTDQNGDFILSANFISNYDKWFWKSMIVKVTPDFDTTIRVIDDTLNKLFSPYLLITQNNHYILNAVELLKDDTTGNYTQLAFIVFDEDMNQIAFKRYDISDPDQTTEAYMHFIQNEDGRIYGFGRSGLEDYFLIVEINEMGDTLRTNTVFTGYPGVASSSGVMPSHRDDLAMVAFGEGYNLNAQSEVYDIDTSLNIAHQPIILDSATGNYFFSIKAKWLNDSIYLATGSASYGKDNKEIILYKANANQNHQVVADYVILNSPGSDQPCIGSPSFIDPSYIYIGSCSYAPAGWNITEEYMVALIDEDLNLTAMKTFGKEGRNYVCNAIQATDDFGCIVSGTVHYPDSANTDWDMFVRKISLENMVGIAEQTADPDDSDYYIYPNPGNDKLYVNTARQGVIMKVYNMAGKKIMEIPIRRSLDQEINVQSLLSGSYLLKFTDEEGFRETKKWVKQ